MLTKKHVKGIAIFDRRQIGKLLGRARQRNNPWHQQDNFKTITVAYGSHDLTLNCESLNLL